LILAATEPAAVERMAALLRAGELVAFPTDTVYGLGALFSRPSAIERIYAAKGRPEGKAIPILLASPADLPLVAGQVGEVAARLAEAFWPGPLTLVLPKAPLVPVAVSRTGTVAVRVPDHPLARALIAAAGTPLAVTSANRSGEPATTDPAVVYRMLAGKIAALLDGGLAPGGLPSTVVDCARPGTPLILRPGPITADDLAATMNRP
jgi:L-threonylcarbamoyladenylate synthase